MARIEYAPRVAEDYERIVEHLLKHEVAELGSRLDAVEASIGILALSPELGRRVGDGQRELVIGKGGSGYVARYRYVADVDLVLVLAIKAQREGRYRG